MKRVMVVVVLSVVLLFGCTRTTTERERPPVIDEVLLLDDGWVHIMYDGKPAFNFRPYRVGYNKTQNQGIRVFVGMRFKNVDLPDLTPLGVEWCLIDSRGRMWAAFDQGADNTVLYRGDQTNVAWVYVLPDGTDPDTLLWGLYNHATKDVHFYYRLGSLPWWVD